MIAASILLKVTVVILLALASARLARRSPAAVRYVFLAAAFAVLLILPIASIVAPAFTVAVPISTEQLPGPVVEAFAEFPRTAPQSDAGAGMVTAATAAPVSWSSIALYVWVAGALLFFLPVCVGLFEMQSLRRSSLPWRQGQSIVDQWAASSGISRRVDVRLHESISGPLTCGVAHPVILLPSDAVSWPAGELHAAILHELEHIRRRDWVSLCLARTVVACYWFHPAVWIARRQLALEAERACDDAVVERSEATAYADQLVALARRLSAASRPPQLAMANRNDLATRVVAVLDSRQRRGRAGMLCVCLVVAVTVVLVASMSSVRIVSAYAADGASADTAGQGAALPMAAGWEGLRVLPSAAAQQFDVASIKPCDPADLSSSSRGGGAGANFMNSPGLIRINCVSAAHLINRAFIMYGSQAAGDPINAWSGLHGMLFNAPTGEPLKVRSPLAWVYSDRFTIEAKAAGAASEKTMMGPMLRALLEDRFHLKLHQDTEPSDMWTLTVAKSGPKFTPGDCIPFEPGKTDAREAMAANPGKLMCGRGIGDTKAPIDSWKIGGAPMRELATVLGNVIGTPVIDQTGLTGVFNFVFQYGPDEIFSAVQDQLGLKLTKTKGPRGFLVIDHIERPTPDAPASR